MPTRSQRQEHQESAQRRSPAGAVVYRAIYHEGADELARDSQALAWSGLAAGLSMGFSMVVEALLRSHLPAGVWRPLVSKLGYSVGFLIVILGRQQLFTENTLTVILPLLRIRRLGLLRNVLRLWFIVLIANLIGAWLFAAAVAHLPVLEPPVMDAVRSIGFEAAAHSWMEVLLRGIFAGWLIALMVWLLPFAESARVGVIILVTYVVGLGAFSHVIAGSVEVFAAAHLGAISWPQAVVGYTLPSLLGNTIGGVALVAALAHVQFIEASEGQDF
ncbi:MAG TPA: formate/nitrite transporter family protein [Vicinamibacterales bacterium]|nr:formate/nitrite transporter family protein [Vicinamibacterales bacterium]